MDRMKKAAEWFYNNIFRDESIQPREPRQEERIPSPIRTARSLESNTGSSWQSRESLFIKQAKLLANYEDDYPNDCNVVRYYPTYQSLSDRELRSYFSWRTKLRRGDICKTSTSFAFLYIYELINLIGSTSPMNGYRKLVEFRDTYGEIDKSILPYLDRWLTDYVVYYALDPNLLADTPQMIFDRSLTVLENISEQKPAKVMYAVKQLAPKWLERSKFYAEYQDDCDTVIVQVLRRMTQHYATRCKKTLIEQYFGPINEYPTQIFDTAVFSNPLKKRNYEYQLDERCIYRCRNGLWSVRKHTCLLRPNSRLNALLKTIDAMMREAYGYRHPIKCEVDTKWVLKVIQEEMQGLQDQKKAAEEKKITIDYSQLAQIRRDAAITQEKLIVEEELEDEEPQTTIPVETVPEYAEPAPGLPQEPDTDCPLNPTEYRLMQCLLYGRDIGWIQTEGHILSVLLDSINDKLYDAFMDPVLDDTPAPIEDYIDDLKEMIRP